MKSRTTIPSVVAGIVALAAIAAGSLLAPAPASATTFVPYQFIAKLYTDGLGRAPDQSGWTSAANTFTTSGCTTSSLSTVANGVLLSPEFTALGLSAPAKVEVAYRTLLNREPDASGLALYSSQPMSSITAAMEASAEFATLAGMICSTADYHFGTAAPIALGAGTTGYNGSEAGLQALLNSAASGSTVTLAARALIPLTSTLTVPSGVTLATAGTPGHYAEMGRLVRQPGWSGNSVNLAGGGHIDHVWIEGDRLRESSYDRLRFNLQIFAGSGTSLTNSRVGNTAGATSMQINGVAAGETCTGTVISGNIVEAYSAVHDGVAETDGITGGCGAMSVHDNTVVDASDVGIILFGSPSYTQASQVYNNTVIQAGKGAHAMLAFDSSTSTYPATASPVSFAGASMHDNRLWSSPAAVSTFAISVGTFAYFGPSTIGTGGSVTNNTSGTLAVAAEAGIGISGQLSTTVTGNTVGWISGDDPTSSCPHAAVGASVTAGYASGTLQAYTDLTYSMCWDRP